MQSTNYKNEDRFGILINKNLPFVIIHKLKKNTKTYGKIYPRLGTAESMTS